MQCLQIRERCVRRCGGAGRVWIRCAESGYDKGYRIIFEQLHSGHPWNALENDEFLMKLRAKTKNKNGTLSPTIAGLLFFGRITLRKFSRIIFLDYREEC